MRKFQIGLFFLFYFPYPGFGQKQVTLHHEFSGKKYSVSTAIEIPVGQFYQTHLPGVGAAFGKAPDFYPAKSGNIYFTYTAGIRFFAGRNDKVSGYNYRYPSFLVMHAFGGLAYNLSSTLQLSLTAGPGLGFYNRTTRFNPGLSLSTHYFFGKTFGAGAGLLLVKENKADPLQALTLQAILLLK